MKYLFLFFVMLFANLYAYTLQEILEFQKRDNKTKAIDALRDAKILQSRGVTAFEAPRVGGALAYAEEPDVMGLEYSLSFSQNIINPFDGDEKESLSSTLSKLASQEREYELRIRELDIAMKYYMACSVLSLSKESESLVKEDRKSLQRVEDAYNLGEVSKKELLFSKLDFVKSEQNARKYKSEYLKTFELLQSSVADMLLENLSCYDLVEPKREVFFKILDEHVQLKRVESEKNAAASLEKLYGGFVQNIGYELLYEDEVATKRYRFGVNIPLSSFSSQNALIKEATTQKKLSLVYEKESLKKEIETTTKSLKQRLMTTYDEYNLFVDELLPLTQELLELSEFAYHHGEGSIMEYLDSLRSFKESRLGMLELKKRYYSELFELYKTTDTDFGE